MTAFQSQVSSFQRPMGVEPPTVTSSEKVRSRWSLLSAGAHATPQPHCWQAAEWTATESGGMQPEEQIQSMIVPLQWVATPTGL